MLRAVAWLFAGRTFCWHGIPSVASRGIPYFAVSAAQLTSWSPCGARLFGGAVRERIDAMSNGDARAGHSQSPRPPRVDGIDSGPNFIQRGKLRCAAWKIAKTEADVHAGQSTAPNMHVLVLQVKIVDAKTSHAAALPHEAWGVRSEIEPRNCPGRRCALRERRPKEPARTA